MKVNFCPNCGGTRDNAPITPVRSPGDRGDKPPVGFHCHNCNLTFRLSTIEAVVIETPPLATKPLINWVCRVCATHFSTTDRPTCPSCSEDQPMYLERCRADCPAHHKDVNNG